ncbi:hypothetical protein FB384_004458 [Prauserella sediminis]|uniref:VOC domain-containing protein n=1 Tax=Prauserella sediminis TaxID=577680 RepID=A0A839XRZ5_9PSEU|nr:VOC family protein [Prauserella sediminis]MBB3665501.1 hypothetical protein [Prauserella sediminis]
MSQHPRDTVAPAYRATMMFHPSHHVPDLAAAEDFFRSVFGRDSTPMTILWQGKRDSGPDYSTFTLINDVLFDTIDPRRYILHGEQGYPTVKTPHLKALGWYVEGMTELFGELRGRGIRLLSQLDEPAEGDEPPHAAGAPMPLFFSHPEDTGIRYEFMPPPPGVSPLDPRTEPGWTRPALSADDPLGIVRGSHHTVLTDRPERVLTLVVDVLGGSVIGEGRDEVRGTTCTWVRLADSIFEYAVPDEGTAAHTDWSVRAPQDTYHAITFQVADLAKVERHLASQGVRVAARSDDTLVVDPATALGVPWGFTTAVLPGDDRD